MSDNSKKNKKPPQRHQPRGLTILYEDRDILVVDILAREEYGLKVQIDHLPAPGYLLSSGTW